MSDVPRFQVCQNAVVDSGIFSVERRERDVAPDEVSSRRFVPRRAGHVRRRHYGAGGCSGGRRDRWAAVAAAPLARSAALHACSTVP